MKNASNPFFSVIVPCYNVGQTVLPTLKCLKNQTFKDFEVILVNDGSNDNTQEILEEFRLIQNKNILFQLNKGLGAARNSGIKICKGKFIALLDADDIWVNQKLEKVYDYIMQNNCDLVCHNEYVVNKKNEILEKYFYGPYTKFEDLFFKKNCLSPSAVTFKRSIVDKVGYFSEDLRLHGVEDYDLWLRMAQANIKIQYMPEFLGSYVIHGNNMSTGYNFFNKREYLNILNIKNINIKDNRIVIKFKIKLVKIYISKIRAAAILKMFKEIFNITKDILLLLFSIEKFILKKRIELRG